jgi:CheY-like chemotaxis protein
MSSAKLPRKPNVLIVDDTPANLLALEAVLGDDYGVVRANSAMQALSILQAHGSIDVILLDVQMPIMDGFQAAAEIKKIKGCESIPIIFVTAVYNEDPHVKRGYQVGGVDYFSKPFDPEILRMKVGIYAAYRLNVEILEERERHLRESQELLSVGRKLSSVLEDLPVGVLIADVEGRICQTTEEVSRILNSPRLAEDGCYGEILGWWDESGRMLKQKEGPLARALHRGEPSHSESMDIRRGDGSSTTVLVSAAPLHGLDRKIVGAVVLVQDLTKAKRIEEDLEQRVTKLIALGVELEESGAASAPS